MASSRPSKRSSAARSAPCSPTGRTTTGASTMPSRRPWPSASRSTSCTTSGRAASWTGSPACCGSVADARLEAPHPGAGRQARPGRARPRREGGGRGAPRRRDGGHLYGVAPDPRDDRAGGDPGGRRRGRPVNPLGRPPDPVPARQAAAGRRRTRRCAGNRRRDHSSGRCRGAAQAGHRPVVRPRHSDIGPREIHRRMGGGTCLSLTHSAFRTPHSPLSRLKTLTAEYRELKARLEQGGGPDKVRRQHEQGKLTARERVAALLDQGATWFEIGLLVASDQYDGQAPGAGVITGMGRIAGRPVVVVANDATVKAGSWWPETIKKMLRAQEIAMRCRIPIVYLVDSSGVNLPYQGGVFPGQYGASRIFYYNSVMRRYLRIPQLAAVMGPCIAGGAYLPALSDLIIMVKGTSFMGLGGPNLVKGATGQTIDAETLGGAATHTEISAVAHYAVDDDQACLKKLRDLVEVLPQPVVPPKADASVGAPKDADALYDLLPADHRMSYDMHAVLGAIVDDGRVDEFQAHLAAEMICGDAKIEGINVGLIANQRGLI